MNIFTINAEAAPASIAVLPPSLRRKKNKDSSAKAADAVAQTGAPSADPLPMGELRTAKLTEIVVEGRARKDLGDLRSLARSMRETGLAQPPLVDAQMRLVCGYRRYKAAESLGWTEMPVRVLDIEDPLALTVAEDSCRKDLTASEKYAIAQTLRERAKEADWRKSSFGGRLDEADQKGRLDEAIAASLRLSRETLRKINAIHAAAEEDPANFADLVEKLDRDGRVDRHYRELELRRARLGSTRAAAIVVAPGWRALYDLAEAKDVARYAKATLLAAGADEGTVLLHPSAVADLADAVGLLRQGGFEWRATLRGSEAPGEDLWLVGVRGRKAEVAPEATELLAEACAQGVDAVFQAAEAAFAGVVRSLDLAQETGA